MTLFQFYKEFDTEEKCVDYLMKVRWGNKVCCPKCGHCKCYILSERGRKWCPRFKCANNQCYFKFTVTTGTMFHATNAPLVHFFYLMFSSSMNKKNVSSVQQSLNLGITQKTAWFIMMCIRKMCFQDEDIILSGTVEIDECYVAKKGGHWEKRYGAHPIGRKIPVLGLIERGGNVVVKVIPKRTRKIVEDVIFRHVEVDSTIYTDGHACYSNLSSYFKHEWINHRGGDYVRGDVYTNTIESFWSQVKKAVVGTHHCVSIEHLQSYCDEVAYRYNTRKMTPFDKFNDLLKRACSSNHVGYKDVKLDVLTKVQERNGTSKRKLNHFP